MKCIDCEGNIVTDYIHGEKYCSSCGLVVENNMYDCGIESYVYDERERNKLRGGSRLKASKVAFGLSTTIDRYDRDAGLRKLPPENLLLAYRLRKLQKRSLVFDAKGKNFTIAFQELDKLCSVLGIPESIKEEVAVVYRKAHAKGVLKGFAIEVGIAGAIHLVSRQKKQPITIKALVSATGLDKQMRRKSTKKKQLPSKALARKQIFKCYKAIVKCLNITPRVITGEDFLFQFCSELGYSGKTEHLARQLVRQALEKGISSGKTPISVALGTIQFIFFITKDTEGMNKLNHLFSTKNISRTSVDGYFNLLKKSFRLGKIDLPKETTNVVKKDKLFLRWSQEEIEALKEIKSRKGLKRASDIAKIFKREQASPRKISSIVTWISRNKNKLK